MRVVLVSLLLFACARPVAPPREVRFDPSPPPTWCRDTASLPLARLRSSATLALFDETRLEVDARGHVLSASEPAERRWLAA
ncbi:MAG: hypothetical protein H6721_23795, partial [Sandaracinus sp.]|nr:hypothetical protein [Sandaracinus sp.]